MLWPFVPSQANQFGRSASKAWELYTIKEKNMSVCSDLRKQLYFSFISFLVKNQEAAIPHLGSDCVSKSDTTDTVL